MNIVLGLMLILYSVISLCIVWNAVKKDLLDNTYSFAVEILYHCVVICIGLYFCFNQVIIL